MLVSQVQEITLLLQPLFCVHCLLKLRVILVGELVIDKVFVSTVALELWCAHSCLAEASSPDRGSKRIDSHVRHLWWLHIPFK